jgi:hypothetical protein
MTIITLGLYSIFASNEPNILINGYLGQSIPPSIILEADSTIVEENGSAVPIVDNYNFTTNRTSINKPVNVYVGYASFPYTTDVIFDFQISTEGFKVKNTSGVLVGSALDVDILMHTESQNVITSKILVGTTVLDTYNKNIFASLSSTPASFAYSVNPGSNIGDVNYFIWFTWGEKLNVPAGQYGSLINFAITTN